VNNVTPWWDMTAAEMARAYPEERETTAIEREQRPTYEQWRRETVARMAAEKAERAARGIKW